jgi:hypothetical protein
LEEKLDVKDKVWGGLLWLEVLSQDLYDAGGISGMGLLVDCLGREALNEFAVELFGEEDDCLDDGLFHSLDLLGWIVLETEVELLVIWRNWPNGIIKEKYPEQVQEQLAHGFFCYKVFPSLCKALIKQFQDHLNQVWFLDKALKSI